MFVPEKRDLRVVFVSFQEKYASESHRMLFDKLMVDILYQKKYTIGSFFDFDVNDRLAWKTTLIIQRYRITKQRNNN